MTTKVKAKCFCREGYNCTLVHNKSMTLTEYRAMILRELRDQNISSAEKDRGKKILEQIDMMEMLTHD